MVNKSPGGFPVLKSKFIKLLAIKQFFKKLSSSFLAQYKYYYYYLFIFFHILVGPARTGLTIQNMKQADQDKTQQLVHSFISSSTVLSFWFSAGPAPVECHRYGRCLKVSVSICIFTKTTSPSQISSISSIFYNISLDIYIHAQNPINSIVFQLQFTNYIVTMSKLVFTIFNDNINNLQSEIHEIQETPLHELIFFEFYMSSIFIQLVVLMFKNIFGDQTGYSGVCCEIQHC